jgi:diguanylate cyclase (GGDEF)-like protein
MEQKQSSQFVVAAPLFYKILGGIVLPLILLLSAFAFMTFRRELAAEVERAKQQNEMVLKSINEQYVKMFALASVPPQKQSKEELREQVRFLKSTFNLEAIDLVQPLKNISLVNGRNLTDKRYALEAAGMAKALSERRRGKLYHIQSQIKMFTKNQSVFGYIPFRHKDVVEPLVLVTVFETSLREVVERVALSLAIMFAVTFFVGLAIALRLTHRIVRPIQAINRACGEMLSGKLGLKVEVRTGDEIEVMAKNFNKMSEALMVMKRKAEDSNPLTQLPGNKQIMADLVQRIDEHRKFVYFHVDIDHFKAYNDAYGLGKGDDVLRRTSDVLREAIAEMPAGSNVFLGHQGGDDFVIIVEPHVAEELGQTICKKFDATLTDYYDKETLERGYFTGEDARHEGFGEAEIKRHSLMSISLAGVSNQRMEGASYDEILREAVRVKKKAKKIPYSKALIEDLKLAA